MRDLWGQSVRTSAAGLAAWNQASRALIFLTDDLVPALDNLVAIDPSLAIARAVRAAASASFGLPWKPRQEAAAAEAMISSGATARERSAVHGLLNVARGKPIATADALTAHLREFPGDPIVGQFMFAALASTARHGDMQMGIDLVEQQAVTAGAGDWAWSGLVALVRAERHQHVEAAELAQRVLVREPRAIHAAHALAHCYFYTGAHSAGLGWLDKWLAAGNVVGYGPHLSWHAALHELFLGDLTAVRRRYEEQLPPSDVRNTPSLLWRLRLADSVYDQAWAEQAAAAARRMMSRQSTVFAGFNAALAFSLVDDKPALMALEVTTSTDGRPGFADLLTPVIRALIALVDGRHDLASDLLISLLPGAPLLGGSSVQREILEDILLHTLLRAGRVETAAEVLERRLDRRPASFYEHRLLRVSHQDRGSIAS